MRILIQHPKEFALAIAVVVMNAIAIGKAIKEGALTQDLIVAFLVAIFSLLGLYFNIPTSEENAVHTGMMRLEKEQNNGIITGEDFFDEYEEDEEGEDLEPDEEATEEIDDGPEDGEDDE